MNEEFVVALKEINDKLKDSKIKWGVFGSYNLVLQGLPAEPRDIDILTDETGAYEIEKIFQDKSVKKVEFSSTGKIQSHYGAFKIGDVKVEIIGDFRSSIDFKPIIDFSGGIVKNKMDDLEIPCLPLEMELEAYKKLDRQEKVEMIKRVLEK